MKKIFTLLTALFAVMAVNAQKITFAVGGSTTEWSSGDFKITATDTEGKIAIDANSTYFGTATEQIQYGSRLKSGGKSTSNLFLTATIPADGTLKISARTGSNSATDRNVVVTQEDKEILNKILLESEAIKVTIGDKEQNVYPVASFPVKAGSATITFPVGSVNFYAIEFVEGTGGGDTPGGDDYANKEIMDIASEAIQSTIAAAIANPTALSNPNFFIVSQDKKVYPMGTNDAGAVDVLAADGEATTLATYIWEHNSGNMAFKAVSTPNADATPEESWQKKNNGVLGEDGTWSGNEMLDVEGCAPQFHLAFGPKNGNPTSSYKDFYEYNQDGNLVHRVYDGPYWAPGCGWVPAKGCFYEFTPSVAGSLNLAFWVANANNAQIYVVNKTDNTVLPNSEISAIGFLTNKNWMLEQGWPTNVVKFMLNNDNKLITAVDKDGVTPTPTASPQGRKWMGYITFAVEANKTYMFFSPKMQPAIFGYEFSHNGTTGISNIVVEKAKNDAIYNIAGQRVSGSAKGLVIKNGKKYFVK